jgi:RNA polymerase sigma-70 factor (ECF subfamily)
MTASEDFTGHTDRFRGELLAHCYQMLGSVDEAEDLVPDHDLAAAETPATAEELAVVPWRR